MTGVVKCQWGKAVYHIMQASMILSHLLLSQDNRGLRLEYMSSKFQIRCVCHTRSSENYIITIGLRAAVVLIL